MKADGDSHIAWHRAQLRKNRELLKGMETSRFTTGEIAGSRKPADPHKTVVELKRKIRESEKILASYDKQTIRPRTTDFQSLSSVRWGSWNSHVADAG